MNLLIIFCAKYLIVIPPVFILALLFALRGKKRRFMFMVSAGSLVLAYGLALVAGHLYYNPRPFVVGDFTPLVAHAANNGFPSDHMLLAATLAMLGWVVSRRIGVLLWVVALLVGFGRVASGVHHVLDVAASAGIAIVAVLVVHWLVSRWFGKSAMR